MGDPVDTEITVSEASRIPPEDEASQDASDDAESDSGDNLPDTPNPGRNRMNDRLWRLSELSRMDGSTEVPVVEWMPEDYRSDVPVIRYENPLRDDKTCAYQFDMPKGDTMDHELVRFLDEYGLSLSSVDNDEGDVSIEDFDIKVEHVGEDATPEWEPVIPDYEPPKHKQHWATLKQDLTTATGSMFREVRESPVLRGGAKGIGAYLIVLSWPITGWLIAHWAAKEADSPGTVALSTVVFGGVLCFFVWMLTGMFDSVTFELLFHTEPAPGSEGMDLVFHGW